MSSCWVVMVELKQAKNEWGKGGNVDSVLVQDLTVNFEAFSKRNMRGSLGAVAELFDNSFGDRVGRITSFEQGIEGGVGRVSGSGGGVSSGSGGGNEILRLDHNLALMLQTFIPFLGQISGSSSQCVGFTACFARSVIKLVVEAREKDGPAGLAAIEVLFLHEVLEVPMICENMNLFRGTFQFCPPFL